MASLGINQKSTIEGHTKKITMYFKNDYSDLTYSSNLVPGIFSVVPV